MSVLLGGRVVRLDGVIRQAEAALGVKTALVEVDGEAVVGFHGEQSLPASLAEAVIGVLGLDGRSYRREPRVSATTTTAYRPLQVAGIYNFPESYGSGQSIGIIALNGGYQESVLYDYFLNTLGLPQAPIVNAWTVSGEGNNPDGSHDGEVYMDIEIVGGIAFQATINVYFGEGFSGQVAGIAQAIEDGNSVITSSWGSNWESSFSRSQRDSLNTVLHDAADANVTVLHGAGDSGSWGGTKNEHPTADNNAAHATYPPTSPWITAAGGTTLTESSEEVWNRTNPGSTSGGATGGGVSEIYEVPDYQVAARINPVSVNDGSSGRGIPDVASVADPNTGYHISVDGVLKTMGGDSAAGPLWAALIAILNEQLGTPIGFLNPIIYRQLAGAGLNDITSGNNVYNYGDVRVPGYDAATGWDACTGFGSPNGTALLDALQSLM